ncbi:transcription factor [Cryptosporidium felis]|nr:transcription factor [Cryptosporidium felis]
MLHPSTSSLCSFDDSNKNIIPETHFIPEDSRYEFGEFRSHDSTHFNFINGHFSDAEESDSEHMLSLEYDISQNSNRKKRKGSSNARRKTRSQPNISMEIEKLLQKANDAYLEKKFITAIEILEDIVVKAPGLHDPFHMLGLIYEQELDDKEKAIGFYLVAAHLVNNDFFLWRRIGQMSSEIKDWNRAIYCYSKCIKNINNPDHLNSQDSTAQLEDEVRFELSNAYYSLNDINRCIQQLKILFWRHPGDPLLGKELARCYHKIGKLNLAAEILESCIDFCEDINIVNMLCEVYIELKLFQKCVELIHNYFGKFNHEPNTEIGFSNDNDDLNKFLRKIPIDIATKYAVANVNLGNHESAFHVSKIINEYKNVDEFSDLHQILGDAYFQIGNYKDANDHYSLVARTKFYHSNIQFNVNYAYSLHKLGLNENAANILKDLLEKNRNVSGDFNISKAKTLLASIYSKMGFETLSRELIYTMKYDEIVQSKDISTPIPKEMRMSMVLDLFSEMKENFHKIMVTTSLLPFLESAINPKFLSKNDFKDSIKYAERFSNIMNEFLKDIKRVNQLVYSRKYNENSKPVCEYQEKQFDFEKKSGHFNESINAKKKSLRANIQLSKIRNELGLITLEEIFTSEKEFWEFLSLGAIYLQDSKKYNVAVELFEKLLNNLKLVFPEINGDQNNKCKRYLQNLLLSLSFEGGIWRALLGFLREEYNRTGTRKKSISKVMGCLILMPQIFASKLSIANNCFLLEKETIGETRSWIQRQAANSGSNIELLIITAHLYVLSNRLNQALSEYVKIHRLLPFDDMISLCLGASLIGIATSKDSKNRIFSIIKGFSFMTRYSRGRQSIHANDGLFRAECYYNLARAFHQINLKTNAISCYIKCINVLNQNIDKYNYDYNKLKSFASYNLSLLLRVDLINEIVW